MPYPANFRNKAKRSLIGKKIAEALTKKKPETLQRLEEAFKIGANVRIACTYAGIAESTYYLWMSEDKELSERMHLVKDTNIIVALDTISKAIKTDPAAAFKYVKHKVPDEWGDKIGVEHSGAVLLGVVDIPTQAAIDAYNKAKEEETLKAIDNEPEELHL